MAEKILTIEEKAWRHRHATPESELSPVSCFMAGYNEAAKEMAPTIATLKGRVGKQDSEIRELERLLDQERAQAKRLKGTLSSVGARVKMMAAKSEWITEPRLRNWKDVAQRLTGEAALTLAEIQQVIGMIV